MAHLARLLVVLPILGLLGCHSMINVMAIPYFLMRGDAEIPPACELVKGRKDSRRVVILSYANSGLRFGYDAVDADLGDLLGREIAKGDSRIEVVPDRKVRAWKDTNPGWYQFDLQEVGEYFDVDYVLFVEVNHFSLNEEKSQYLLRGRSKVLFKVHDVNRGHVIFDDMYEREYPPSRSVPLSDVASEDQFRKMFQQRIAMELSWYVVGHQMADQINDL